MYLFLKLHYYVDFLIMVEFFEYLNIHLHFQIKETIIDRKINTKKVMWNN